MFGRIIHKLIRPQLRLWISLSVSVLIALAAAAMFLLHAVPSPVLWTVFEYTQYQGPKGGPHFSFDGPQGWLMKSYEPMKNGEDGAYASWSVSLLGPSSPNGTTTTLSVSAIPRKSAGGYVDGPDDVSRNEKAKEREGDVLYYRIDSETNVFLDGKQAIELVVRGRLPKFNEGVPSPNTLSVTKMVMAVNGAQHTFVVELWVDPEEAAQYRPVYQRAVNTLKFDE